MPARGHVAPERSGDARHERRGTPRVAASDRSRSPGAVGRAVPVGRGARGLLLLASYWLDAYVTRR